MDKRCPVCNLVVDEFKCDDYKGIEIHQYFCRRCGNFNIEKNFEELELTYDPTTRIFTVLNSHDISPQRIEEIFYSSIGIYQTIYPEILPERDRLGNKRIRLVSRQLFDH